MSADEQQELIDNWDGAVGDELEGESPFLAEIMADEIVPGKWGPQWHVAVKPLQFELRGKTGMFHDYFSLSKQARSKMGAMLTSIVEHKVVEKGTPYGKGALIGLVAWFVRRDIRFGKSSTGEPIVSEGVLIFYKKATDEEQLLAGTSPPSTNGAASATPALVPASDWTEEQIEAVLAALEGLNTKELQRAALDRNHPASKLPRELKAAVLNGSAVDYLTSTGKAELTEGGVVSRLALV